VFEAEFKPKAPVWNDALVITALVEFTLVELNLLALI
tara:strand:- start:2563 stop:2673 length:111 start_codon:yes stop_codon:yes gene_type:complete